MYSVLFDIDGTLIQTGGAGQLAFAEAFADEFGVAELSSSVSFAGRSDRAIALDLMVAHGVDASDENWHRFRESYLARLPKALESREGRVLAGVHSLIEQLQQRKETVLVGLLTGNLRRGAHAKLSFYGLHNEFPFGGFGDDTIDRNEIASIALREAKHFAETASTARTGEFRGAMVIGDTIFDIRCARSIGALAVAVPTGATDAETLRTENPDLLMDSLEDVERILQAVDEAMARS